MALRQTEISKEALDALRPEAEAYEVMDSKMDGFGVRVNPSGKIAFILRWSLRGRDGRGTLGAYPALPVMAARKRAAIWKGMLANGDDPRVEKKQLRAAQTVKEFMKDWLSKHVSQLSKKTIKDYSRIVNKAILPALGPRMVADVTEKDALELHQSLAAHPRSANMTLAVLSSALSRAEEWKQRPQGSNPCLHIIRFQEEERARSLSEEEMAAFTAFLDQNEEKHSLPVAQLRLLLMTGARLDEVKRLEWAWVDLEGGVICIPKGQHKTGRKTQKNRLVALGPNAVEMLRQRSRCKLSRWVFPGLGRANRNPLKGVSQKEDGPYSGLHSWWQRRRNTELKEIGLGDFHIHDLRHTFATWARLKDVDLDAVGDLLGHTTSRQTRRYAHIMPAKLRADVGLVEQSLNRRKVPGA